MAYEIVDSWSPQVQEVVPTHDGVYVRHDSSSLVRAVPLLNGNMNLIILQDQGRREAMIELTPEACKHVSALLAAFALPRDAAE